MNTGNNMNANYASSQMEPPVLPDAEEAVAITPEHVESPLLPPSSPRRTTPLPASDENALFDGASVAPEQALVTTEQRSILPLATAKTPGQFERWRGVLHPGTFWISVSPVIIGAVTAWLETANSTHFAFHPFRLLFLVLAVVALHGGANLLNESYDVQRGTDGPGALGSSKIIQRGLLPAYGVRRASFVLFGVGALILLMLGLVTHAWGVLIFGGVSLLLAYFYSATRYALGYFPLSELIIGFVMGPAALLSSVQLQGAPVSSQSITFALALGVLAAAVMLANNLRDLETDRAANKRTLVTYLGAQMGRALYLALVLLPYLLIALVAFPSGRPHGVLVVLLTIPSLFVVITGTLRAETPAASNLVVAQTRRLHLRFSALLLAGYLLSFGVIYLLSLFK